MKFKICYQKIFVFIVFMMLIFPLTKINMEDISQTENRTLAKFPEKVDNEFSNKIELFINDRFRGRDKLLKISNTMEENMIGYPIGKKAAIGKDGWIFYTGDNSILNFQNKILFTEFDLENVKNSILKKKEILAKRGIKYYVMIAPDKNRIYGECYIPFINKVNDCGRAEQLVKFLRENDIDIIYPKDVIEANKVNGNLYYKLDTHWNTYGAFLGYSVLMDEIIKDSNSNNSINKLKIEDYRIITTEESGGDLLGMLNITRETVDSSLTTLKLEKNNDYKYQYIQNEGNKGVETINTAPLNNKRVYMLRDSFTNAMVPYISESFSHVKYNWTGDFNQVYPEIIQDNPDIVIQEIVERSIICLTQDITVE